MHIDHVSYITPRDQLADTVQRLGARLGSTLLMAEFIHALAHATSHLYYKMVTT